LRKNEILDLLAKSKLVSGKYSGSTKINQLYKTTNIEGFSSQPSIQFIQEVPLIKQLIKWLIDSILQQKTQV